MQMTCSCHEGHMCSGAEGFLTGRGRGRVDKIEAGRGKRRVGAGQAER